MHRQSNYWTMTLNWCNIINLINVIQCELIRRMSAKCIMSCFKWSRKELVRSSGTTQDSESVVISSPATANGLWPWARHLISIALLCIGCWGMYDNLSAHRFSAELAFACNKNLVYSEMVMMMSWKQRK